jgi:hypothetical protein
MFRESVESAGVAGGRTTIPPIAYPVPIAGHGSSSIARAAADPLEINAILLTSGERRCLVVSFDLLYIGGALERDLRAKLAARYGLHDRDVMLFASHTHFAPPTDASLPDLGPIDEAYAERVAQQAVALVGELVSRTPAPLGVEVRSGELSHSINRRRPRLAPSYTRSGGLSMARVSFAPYPAGLRDETATLITLVNRATQTPVATIWNYACHPVSHMPSDTTSADFPGAVRSGLRRNGQSDLPVLFLQGFCGDIRPNIPPRKIPGLRLALRSHLARIVSGTPWLEVSRESSERWVGSLADRVTEISSTLPGVIEQSAEFSCEHLVLPVDEFFEGSARKTQMQVRGLRLGRNVEILALGAEPSVGWRQRLDTALGPPQGVRVYAGYCGDVVGYLPLPEQVSEGGYEVLGSQPLFGLSGNYRANALSHVIQAAVESVSRSLRGDHTN